MLEVNIDKIIPVTDARDKLNEIIGAAEGSDDLYVITKNGKPSAIIVGVHHLEKLTGMTHEELMPDMEDTDQVESQNTMSSTGNSDIGASDDTGDDDDIFEESENLEPSALSSAEPNTLPTTEPSSDSDPFKPTIETSTIEPAAETSTAAPVPNQIPVNQPAQTVPSSDEMAPNNSMTPETDQFADDDIFAPVDETPLAPAQTQAPIQPPVQNQDQAAQTPISPADTNIQ